MSLVTGYGVFGRNCCQKIFRVSKKDRILSVLSNSSRLRKSQWQATFSTHVLPTTSSYWPTCLVTSQQWTSPPPASVSLGGLPACCIQPLRYNSTSPQSKREETPPPDGASETGGAVSSGREAGQSVTDIDGKSKDTKELKEQEEDDQSKGIFARFKDAYKNYGKVLVGVHLVTSSVWFGTFYYAAHLGIDVVPILKWIGLSDRLVAPFESSGLGNVAVAYLLYKVATPARYTVTIVGTRMVVGYLRRAGILDPVPEGARIRDLVKESREQVRERYEDLRDEVRERREGYKEKFEEKKDEFKERFEEKREEYREKIEEKRDEIKDSIRKTKR